MASHDHFYEQLHKHTARIFPRDQPRHSFSRAGLGNAIRMPEDPFKDFKFIPQIDEMLETTYSIANKRADSISGNNDTVILAKRRETKRIQVAYKHVMEFLEAVVKSVPDLSALPPFYFDLAQVLVDNNLLKKKLGRISGAIRVLERLMREHVRAIPRLHREAAIHEKRKEAFGRMKSVVEKLQGDFEYLRAARAKLRALPVIDTDVPAIVIAGYPNVGKSSIVNNFCGSKIQVAAYPFTTKDITIGHYQKGFFNVQIVDTPGVLDRPMIERNVIERQAITALKHLANIIAFLIDPTPNCGYSTDAQLALLDEVAKSFPTTPRMIIITKKDIVTKEELATITTRLQELGETTIVSYSSMSRENEDQLLAILMDKVKPFQRRVTR